MFDSLGLLDFILEAIRYLFVTILCNVQILLELTNIQSLALCLLLQFWFNLKFLFLILVDSRDHSRECNPFMILICPMPKKKDEQNKRDRKSVV